MLDVMDWWLGSGQPGCSACWDSGGDKLQLHQCFIEVLSYRWSLR